MVNPQNAVYAIVAPMLGGLVLVSFSRMLGGSGVLGRLMSFAWYLGVRMLLLKLCDVNRGRKRGCCGRALAARESLE
jgi:hypothetical protein